MVRDRSLACCSPCQESPRVEHNWVTVRQQLDLIWACILKEFPSNSYMHPDWEALIQSITEAAKNEHLRTEAFKVLTWEMIKRGMLSYISRVQLFATLWTVGRQAPLSMGFSMQEYWRGLPSPTPGDLPNPGRFFTTKTTCSGVWKKMNTYLWLSLKKWLNVKKKKCPHNFPHVLV